MKALCLLLLIFFYADIVRSAKRAYKVERQGFYSSIRQISIPPVFPPFPPGHNQQFSVVISISLLRGHARGFSGEEMKCQGLNPGQNPMLTLELSPWSWCCIYFFISVTSNKAGRQQCGTRAPPSDTVGHQEWLYQCWMWGYTWFKGSNSRPQMLERCALHHQNYLPAFLTWNFRRIKHLSLFTHTEIWSQLEFFSGLN